MLGAHLYFFLKFTFWWSYPQTQICTQYNQLLFVIHGSMLIVLKGKLEEASWKNSWLQIARLKELMSTYGPVEEVLFGKGSFGYLHSASVESRLGQTETVFFLQVWCAKRDKYTCLIQF